MRKPAFCKCENKDMITAKLISAFVFAILIVQSLNYLNPKFQASGHLLWLYSLVCVGPGWKSRRPVFSQRGSNSHFFVIQTKNDIRFCFIGFIMVGLSSCRVCVIQNTTPQQHAKTSVRFRQVDSKYAKQYLISAHLVLDIYHIITLPIS